MPGPGRLERRELSTLLVDIGNTRVKWALAEAGILTTPARAAPHSKIDSVFAAWTALASPPSAVRLVNVNPAPVAAQVTQWVRQHWQRESEVVRAAHAGGGIEVAYPVPEQLGADRWLAMVAAQAKGLLPACLIDAGSAITVDVVHADGRHEGGLILAGIAAQAAGLQAITPGLPVMDRPELVDDPGRIERFATSTPDALAIGSLRGTAAALDGLIAQARQAIDAPLTVVITGGDAPTLRALMVEETDHRPDLVLEGLARLSS